ncbi:MAG: hypothetical protein U5L04_11305 [Trueperaceae bacterium]|nr:hypothetical protein [Trueperaceae bacterium]
MFDALETTLYYVDHDHPDVIAPLLVRAGGGHETDTGHETGTGQEEGKALLLFRSAAAAAPHRDALGSGAVLVTLKDDDFRAKEELLRAAIVRGASEVWLEPSPTLTPDHILPIAKALFYILSFRRERACL